jgi:hypothetical protein
MDEPVISQGYESPRVVDYGDLQELTADCGAASGGDSYVAGGTKLYGVSNPVYKCKSEP